MKLFVNRAKPAISMNQSLFNLKI